MSAGGRYVAFSSHGNNLVPGDTNRASDVFVRDRETHRTVRVSVTSRGGQADADSFGPSISGDGRLVAFISWATNLVPGGTKRCLAVAAEYPGCGNAYVHDMTTGVTSRVSVSNSGRQGNERTETAIISTNGRLVAFGSWASNLVSGDRNECSEGTGADQPPGCPDVFVRDLRGHTTERVSVEEDGAELPYGSGLSGVADDGMTVAFRFDDPTASEAHIYVRDRAARTTVRVPYPEGTSTFQGQRVGVITGDGTQVLYTIDIGSPPGCRTRFAPPGEQICTSYHQEMYAYHLATRTTERITPGVPSGEELVWDSLSISREGRYVLFTSARSDLVPVDRNGSSIDVFLFDRSSRSLALVSVSSRGSQGRANSYDCRITPDGSAIVFASLASNLVSGDTNRAPDVFFRDLRSGTTSRVSVSSTA